MKQIEEHGVTISPYPYAKGMVVVRAPSTDGFKTRGARLADALGGRYVNRARGYVMSPRKAAALLKALREGRDAELGNRNGVLAYVIPAEDA